MLRAAVPAGAKRWRHGAAAQVNAADVLMLMCFSWMRQLSSEGGTLGNAGDADDADDADDASQQAKPEKPVILTN